MTWLRENIGLIVKAITVFVFLSGGLWTAWGYAGQIKQNTNHRVTQEYWQLIEWTEGMEKKCGPDAKNCAEWKQDMVRQWKTRMDVLEVELGIRPKK